MNSFQMKFGFLMLLCRSNVAQYPCGTKMAEGLVKECSAECPYLRYSIYEGCSFRCVNASMCNAYDSELTFADPVKKRCRPCLVPACTKCGATHDDCEICQDGFFRKDDGSCIMKAKLYLWVIYAVVGLIVFLVLMYLVTLGCREAVNAEVYEDILVDVDMTRLRDEQYDDEPLYPLTTNLRVEPIAGRGNMLFFRHMWILLWCSVAIAGALLCMAVVYDLKPGVIPKTPGKLCSSQGQGAPSRLEHLDKAEHAIFWFVVALYVCGSLGTFALAVAQRVFYCDVEKAHTSMSDYALLASGFPVEGGDQEPPPLDGITPEEEYREFFSSIFDEPVVGVSVCWAFHDDRDKVAETMQKEIATTEWGIDDKVALEDEDVPRGGFVDNLLCGIGGGDDDRDDAGKSLGEQMATQFPTSGSAIVVFRTKEAQIRAREMMQNVHGTSAIERDDHLFEDGEGEGGELSYKFRGHHKIELRSLDCGARDVVWSSFGRSFGLVVRDLVVCIVGVLLFIVFWTVVFYGPYAYYILFSSHVKGKSVSVSGGVLGTLLGLVITAGNVAVYTLIGTLAVRIGWLFDTDQQNFNLIMYTFAVFINTCLDLYTTLLMAHGEVSDAAMMEEKDKDPLNPKALNVPSAAEAFSNQLFAYLFPGTILLPFFAEPALVTFFAYVGKWVVRSRIEITHAQAQGILALPDFELSRYGDVVINILLCVIMLYVTSTVMAIVWCSLVASMLFIFMWDRCRLLRVCAETTFQLDTVERTAHYLLILPCAVLAGAIVFRSYKLKFIEGLHQDNLQWFVLGAIVLHVIIHACLMKVTHVVARKVTESEEELDDEEYELFACRHAANWFNTNPIHCLRSKYVFGFEPPCIYFAKGKESLLRPNEEVHCYFDGEPIYKQIIEKRKLKRSMSRRSDGSSVASIMDASEDLDSEVENML